MTIQTLNNIDISNKIILLRTDLNVPVQDGVVTDTTRIDRVKPTIDYLLQHGAKRIIVLSHFGRPKGKENPEFSLSFLPEILSQQWGVDVGFGKDATEQITLLENLRFHPGEEKNDPAYAQQLASLGDVFVNDAFSCAHRAHASTEGIAHLMPAVAGLLMEAEISALNNALEAPKNPVMAIVGGAKISTKLSVLNNLVTKVDYLVLGGGMANTFLAAQGYDMGASLMEEDMLDEARMIMRSADKEKCSIILPVDMSVVEKLAPGVPYEQASIKAFPVNKSAVDAGEQSIQNAINQMNKCKTLLWNGPMGVFEIPPFDAGTNKIAQHAAQLTRNGDILSVAGGGDTVAALENAKVIDEFSYISTAGGAFLEWIEGKSLPGVTAISTQQKDAA